MTEKTLQDLMTAKGTTMTRLSKDLGMARSTLYRKLKAMDFLLSEVVAICKYLDISDPFLIIDIFLPQLSQK